MKNFKKVSIQNILLITIALLIICSLQSVTAANQTIDSNNAAGIKGAIDAAGDGDTVFFQPGTYNKTGNDTNFTISKNITIQGNGSTDSVIIDAQGLSRIFYNSIFNVTFVNITFLNGGASALYANPSSIMTTVINCTFINCTSVDGGAIDARGPLTVINSTFTNNTATIGGAIFSSSQCTIINSTFIGNSATDGGAIRSGGILNIAGSNFINNSATNGGAIYKPAANMYINDTVFIDNTATDGGAINIIDVYDLRAFEYILNNVTATNNSADRGSAIYADAPDNNLTIINSNFSNNDGNSTIGSNLNINMTNNNISNNTGNGIVNNGTANIVGNTIFDNGGYGLVNDGNVDLVDNNFNDNCIGSFINNGNATGHGNNFYRIIILAMTSSVQEDKIIIIVTATNEVTGEPIAGLTINFYVDNEKVGTGITDSNGIAKYTYTILTNKTDDNTKQKTAEVTFILFAELNQQTIPNLLGQDIFQSFQVTETIKVNITTPDPAPTPTPIPTPDPTPTPTPIPTPKPDNNDTNENTNNLATTNAAAMKKTGLPIILALLTLFTSIGLLSIKKDE